LRERMKEDTKKILLHTAILFAVTLPFWVFNIDMQAQSVFFDFPAKMWKYLHAMPVKILYDFGVYPAIIMTAIAAIVFGLGFAYKKMEKHRKTALLIMLTLFIGPAVTINVILKNYTGRPRPREIREFNGRMDFKNVFELGTPGRGYSFPCGHASMGFLFMALYFAYRRKNKAAACAALFGGLAYGSAMGAARMAQGAHFLSDVIWACGITFISAEIAWYKILGGDRKSAFDAIKAGKSGKTVSVAVITLLLFALVIIFLFSVPFANDRSYSLKPVKGVLELVMNVEGDVRIVQKKQGESIELKAAGFGFPRRMYDGKLESIKTKNGVKYVFNSVKKGFFAELNSTVDVSLPKAEKYMITVNDSNGDIECELYGDAPLVMLSAKNGDIEFKAGGMIKDVYIKAQNGGAETAFDVDAELSPAAFIDINVKGPLGMTNRSAFFKDLNLQGGKITGSRELYYKSTKKGGPGMSVKAGRIIIR